MNDPGGQDASRARDEAIDDFFEQLSHDGEAVDIEGQPRSPQRRERHKRSFFQISLWALLSLTALTGGVASAWATRNLGGLLALLLVLYFLAYRRRDSEARLTALRFYGGALGLCGGLLMSHSHSERLAFAGLCLAGIGSFFAIHAACGPLFTAAAASLGGEASDHRL